MCIFSHEVIRVSGTRILIMPLGSDQQLTVYENTVESGSRNAMILPVPSGPAGSDIQLLDTSKYGVPGGWNGNAGSIWDDCEQYFPRPPVSSGGWGAGGGFAFGGAAAEKEPLRVVRVGGYDCSIAPTLDDLSRASQEIFHIDPNVGEILSEHYATGYSFVICAFDRNVAAHPIAYTSARLPNGACFIPTRHAHGNGGLSLQDGGEAVHMNVRCDHCGIASERFRGARWKCINCPDYDLCDSCYNTCRMQHDADHLFAHVPRPIDQNELMRRMIPSELQRVYDNETRGFPLRFPSNSHPRALARGVDEFDHTIYIANSVLLAGPYTYSDCTESPTHVLKRNDRKSLIKLDTFMEHAPTAGLYSMIKIEIDGAFPNRDYECMPIA